MMNNTLYFQSNPYLSVGFIFLVLPILTWILLNGQRSRMVSFWCVGTICSSIGFILLSMRGTVPDWASFPLAQLLLFVGYLGRIQALRLELSLPQWRLRSVLGVCVVFVLVFEGIRLGLESTSLRFGFVLIYNFVLSGVILFLASRIVLELRSKNAFLIVFAHFLVVIIVFARVVELLTGTETVAESFSSIMTFKAGMVGLFSAVLNSLGYIGITLDRSVRRETALKTDKLVALNQSQQVIAQLDRQRSLGALSASLGHELNQPLTAVMANAQTAKKGMNRGVLQTDQVIEILDKIIFNTQRANAILEKIREFIKPARIEKKPVDVNSLVRESAQFINQDLMIRNINLIFNNERGALFVLGDATQLSQVLINLYRNALEALKDQPVGVITVSVTQSAKRLSITVIDNGPGLSEFVLALIGDPFFTTKADGLGLGLSISKAIIEQHGGQLLMGNAEQCGARFEIILPCLSV